MAETVTISTFLELRDNMSAGLKKVEAALDRVNKAQQAAGRQGGKDPATKAAQARAKATEFAAKLERQRIREAEKLAMRELRAAEKAMAAKARAAEASARARIAAERRVAREAERSARQQQKAAERAKRERAEFVGKAGAAMFGPTLGGIAAAAITSPMAALQLGAIGLIQGITDGIKSVVSTGYDLVKGFIVKTFELGREYQIAIRRVAASLVTLDYSPTFELATKRAEQLYDTLRTMAAVLPGETKDYMEVFSMGLPAVLHAGERDLKGFAEKVSQYTAYALSRGVDNIQQTSRDLERMLIGKALGTTRMFREYIWYFRNITQDMQMQAKQFNEMPMDKRLKLMYSAIEMSSETFSYMKDDADALVGTFNSLTDQLIRIGGQPLFDRALAMLRKINAYLTDNNSVLTRTVSIVSNQLGDALYGIVLYVGDIANALVNVEQKELDASSAAVRWANKLKDVFDWLGLVEARERGAQARKLDEQKKLQEKHDEQQKARSSPEYERLMEKTGMETIPGREVTTYVPQPTPQTVITPGTYDPSISQQAQVALLQTNKAIVDSIGGPTKAYDRALGDVKKAATTPTTTKLVPGETRAPQVAKTLGAVNLPADKSRKALESAVIEGYRKGNKSVVTQYAQDVGFNMDEIETLYGRAMGPSSPVHEGGGGGGKAKRPKAAPAQRQTTINDFRFSKFDIKQEFAEGFDPDRIAVAFASDLGKLGEMRMQSAYAPLYSAR